MEKEITVYSNGTVSDTLATVHPGVKVLWKAENGAFDFTVRFKSKQPFKEPKWKKDREETGAMVDGTIKSHGHGQHDYLYDVTVSKDLGPQAGPELIVDGGEGVFEPKKAKKGKAKKAKKPKKAKKGKKTKKSAKKR